MRKRAVSLALCLCMVLSLLPSPVLAVGKHPFTDVAATDWFNDSVQYVYEHELMTGTTETTFSPYRTTSRGMLVTILYRLEDSPAVNGTCPFPDVASGRVFEKPITWAANKGIVNGYASGNFGPDDDLTRQQMAAILYRYAQDKGYDTTASANLDEYTDAESISSYAQAAMAWANAKELINGTSAKALNPGGSATRAQAAAILTRFCQNVVPQPPPPSPIVDPPPPVDPPKITPTSYTVTFDLNYGDDRVYQTLSVEAGEKITAPEKPTRDKYHFLGWYTSATGGSKFNFNKVISAITTLYAHWSKISSGSSGGSYTPISYLVTFISNGTTYSTQTINSGGRATRPSNPSRDGYVFIDWYCDVALQNLFDFNTAISNNTMLYAKWQSNQPMFSLTSPELQLITGEGGDYYYLDSKLEQLTGQAEYTENISNFSYRVSDVNDNTLKEGSIAVNKNWVSNDIAFLMGYNHLTLIAESTGNEDVVTEFDIVNGLSENEENLQIDLITDSDSDNISDYYESSIGTNPNQSDTDDDGLPDGLEYVTLALSPLSKDTDENGTEDGSEDYDSDGLSNVYELANGTDLCISDTDGDGLSDGDEVHTYGTNPLQEDTDSDGVDDATEIAMGTNPLVFNSSFDCRYEYSNEERVVKPTVNIDGLSAEQANQVSIASVTTGQLADTQIPGYIDTAFDFNEVGDFDTAVVSFEIPASLLEDEDFEPAIYWYDEENELLTKVENQSVNGNIISATVTHFSKYMILNAKKYDKVWETELLYDENGEEPFKAIDVVFVLDTSGSMDWNDPYYGRRTVTKNFIDQLTENDLAAVIGFDNSASVYSGFTSDHEALYSAVDQIDNSGGTNLSAAISSALSLFTSSSYQGTERLKFIVMLTDGKGNYSPTYTTQAANLNVIIYTVGLGSEIDVSLLRAIAEGTGGAYYHASRADDLNAIFERIAEESDLYKDTDFDGLVDYYEKEMANGNLVLGTGVSVTGVNYRAADSDNDGLMDGQEISVKKVGNRIFLSMNSNPTVADTDGDGINDPEDANPLVPYRSTILLYQSEKLPGKDAYGNDAQDLGCGDENYSQLLKHGAVFAVANITPEFLMWAEFNTLFAIGTSSASDDMKSVKDDMVKHFRDGSGTNYTNEKLTTAIRNHTGKASVTKVADAVKSLVIEKLKENDGDLGALEFNNNSDVTKAYRQRVIVPYFGDKGLKNLFNDDTYNGLSILLHGLHGWTVTIKDYQMTNSTFSGTIHFHYYDHFGLDEDDEITHFGFCDWYALQHYDRFKQKYRPFISDMEYDVAFNGTY